MDLPKFTENGEMELNEKYQEILALDRMLNNAEIPHELVRMFDGWQIWYPSQQGAVADVVEHFGSYGARHRQTGINGVVDAGRGKGRLCPWPSFSG